MSWLTRMYDATFGKKGKGKTAENGDPEDGKEDEEEKPEDEENKDGKGKGKSQSDEGDPEDEDKDADKDEDADKEKGKKKARGNALSDESGASDSVPGSHALFLKLAARFGEDFAARAFRDRLSFAAALDRHDRLVSAHAADLESRLTSIGKLGENHPPSANQSGTRKANNKPSINGHVDSYAAYLASLDNTDPAA